MGFFDDFRDGLRKGSEEESERSARRQSSSSYRTWKDEEREAERKFESYSDSRLLQEVNSSFTSDENKRIIHSILLRRGYKKVGNNYRRI